MNTALATPLKHLDTAINTIRGLGLPEPGVASAPAVAIASQLAVIDEGRTLAVARVLQQAPYFNQIIRDHLDGASLSTRYEKIAGDFDSIRDDAKRLLEQLADGKIDFKERIENAWMRITRGDIPSRFQRIHKVFLDVSGDSRVQIEREGAILEAYKDFRVALKEGEIIAAEIAATALTRLQAQQAALKDLQAAVETADKSDAATYGRTELARDQGIRAVQDADKLYQTAKSLSENMRVSYSTSEVVMARLQQTTDVKERVYSESVVFFSTNETVLTALNAAFTSQFGLHESTQTLNAMKGGVEKSLEALAEIGDKVLDEGLKTAYGPSIRVESVRALVDSVVSFQERSRATIAEMRQLSAQNANEVRDVVEDGKRRFAALAHAA